MLFHSFIAMEYAFTLFFSLLIARLMRLAIILPAEVSWKRNKMKDFSYKLRNQFLWCSGQVQSRRVEGAGFESYRIIYSYFLFFPFFVLLFSINIQLNNCYLIKCNKQQEKYRVSREKIVHCILNIWINNLNFYHFLPQS